MTSKLPQLGRRGEGWVALQLVLLAAIVSAGVLGANWPAPLHSLRLVIAVALALVGVGLFVGGTTRLGRQITPFPKPVEEGSVKRGGAYGVVRHPMYGGVLLITLGWALVSSPIALVPWALAAVFLDAKRRREEAWLVEARPEYKAYRKEVRRSLLPLVW